jgi:thioredoxin 2
MSETLHVVCPHCHTTNRVRQADQLQSPDCGSCHQSLWQGKPVALNEVAFDKHTLRNQVPVLVDFWAPWCGPCKMMAPAFAQAALALEPHMRLAQVNTEDEQQLASRFNIRSIPTLALFVGGREVARQAGAFRTAADIAQWAQQALRAPH